MYVHCVFMCYTETFNYTFIRSENELLSNCDILNYFTSFKIIVLLSNGNWSAPAYGGNYLKTKTMIFYFHFHF